MLVDCMIRALSISRTHDGLVRVSAAPTYEGRNGERNEVNRAFWEATPSGSVELKLTEGSEARELFYPGEYYLIRFHQNAPAELAGPEWLRSEWELDSLTLCADCFSVRLSTVSGADVRDGNGWRWVPGQNAQLLGRGRAGHGEMQLTINNLSALPLFSFTPQKGQPRRRYVVDLCEAKERLELVDISKG